MPFLLIVLEIESCSDIVCGIVLLDTGMTLSGCVANFDVVLDWILFWDYCEGGLSAICIKGFLPGNNFACSGLSGSQDAGN